MLFSVLFGQKDQSLGNLDDAFSFFRNFKGRLGLRPQLI